MNELRIEGICEIGNEKDFVYRERNRCVLEIVKKRYFYFLVNTKVLMMVIIQRKI